MTIHDWMDRVANMLGRPAWTPDVQARARELYTRGYGTRWATRLLQLWLER